MSAAYFTPVGAWLPGDEPAVFAREALQGALERVRESAHVVRHPATGHLGLAFGGAIAARPAYDDGVELQLLATLPPLYPEWLGDRAFTETHGVRFAYAAGEMANGIATPAMVIAMAEAQMLGFYGAGGLSFDRVEQGLDEIQRALGDARPYGVNLIHSPQEPELEDAVAKLFARRGVTRVCASAYMGLTESVVRYAAQGLYRDANGVIQRRHHVFAKLSRPEVARHFASPAPIEMLRALVARGELSEDEAALASQVPLAEDITVEADSGGHTDNRPLGALFPTIVHTVREVSRSRAYPRAIRVGAAGGLGTPSALAAAFALGAAYVVTGSVNQCAVEAGVSLEAKRMLAQAELADVIMAPAADMFELGVKLQVLRRGTMFAQRALRLHHVYETHESLEAIAPKLRGELEAQIFRASLDDVWRDTQRFFEKRDPSQLVRAQTDPKHKLALVCRWYLGRSSRWAIDGDASRRLDYQVWCGPAMGSFNAWAKGSFLEPVENRTTVQIARNLLEGAAVATRAGHLRASGLPVPAEGFEFSPRPLG